MKLLFESGEYLAIAHHLRVAAEQYARDIVIVKESVIGENGKTQLIKQFDDQIKQCETFADRIEEQQ